MIVKTFENNKLIETKNIPDPPETKVDDLTLLKERVIRIEKLLNIDC